MTSAPAIPGLAVAGLVRAEQASCLYGGAWLGRSAARCCPLLLDKLLIRAAGASYELITDSSGNVVGNFSLTSTPIDPNTNALTLPSTFNASQLLHTGTYTAVITYFPTVNFTTPVPLTITFSITVWLPCPEG